jgi:hypothetical protein
MLPTALLSVRPNVGADHAALDTDHARPKLPNQDIARKAAAALGMSANRFSPNHNDWRRACANAVQQPTLYLLRNCCFATSSTTTLVALYR